jgi:hypothetical protein
MRIIASDGPPAANGTTMVMGCEGNFSAAGALVANADVAISAARRVFLINLLQHIPSW